MKANQAFRSHDKANISISTIIGILLILVVGLSLVSTVQSQTNTSRDAVGSTTAAGNLVVLIPLFFVIILVAAAVAVISF